MIKKTNGRYKQVTPNTCKVDEKEESGRGINRLASILDLVSAQYLLDEMNAMTSLMRNAGI